ncbi:redoxin domain-containing protein [Candidatus Chloroploca asiatica]|uniref:redoxin domain-containing protein n=1 Tax=Candidatus Chloroploca asiatica TaxID=1506545 RepID=UPI000BEA36FD|nr:redoxin domain-containing protein [Candidatus Chloroploca asiatica]
MVTYYTLLGIEPGASDDAIAEAYAHQRERYNPERVTELDPELVKIATERSAELERAYRVLSDPQRRQAYDASLQQPSGSGERRGLTPREIGFAITGVVAAILLVATIWIVTGGESQPETQAMAEMRRTAPSFDAPTLDGSTLNLEAYRGKVILLNFWGTWCEPCKRELPALQAAHNDLSDQGFAVIGVNLTRDELSRGQDTDDVQAFLDQYGVTFPIVLDLEGDITNAYRVFPLPTSFFIDPEGQIRYVHISELKYNDIVSRFTELKGEASALETP